MFSRTAAKIALVLVGAALFYIEMYVLGSALVVALTATLRPAGGYAVAGAILGLPALL